jgi:hypothetical protein
MKKTIVLILLFLSLSMQAQLLPSYYPSYESNRGKGNGKLYYSLYSLNANLVFPDNESQMDAFFGTYGTFKLQNVVPLPTNNGTTNSTSSSASNLINFSNTDQFKSAISNTTPYSGFNGEQYGLIVSGYFIPKQTGIYKFTIEGDDAVDVFINGTNVANHYGGHGASPRGTHTGSISLVAGKKYTFRARFMENTLGDELYLFWQKPSETSGTVWYQDIEELSSEEVLPNGLVLSIDPSNWYVYPKAGTAVTDLKGNATGVLGGSTAYNTTAQGVFYFDGNADYIDFGKTPTNFPTGDISVFVWVKATTLRSNWNIFMTKWFSDVLGNSGGSDFHYDLFNNGSNVYQHLFTTNKSDMFGVTPLNSNIWYYVGFTISNGNLQMYLNGTNDGNVITGAARSTAANSNLWLGDARTNGLVTFNGYIGSAQIYNRAITTDEVFQNYNATKTKYGL